MAPDDDTDGMAPGDEASAEAEGAGENVCPACNGPARPVTAAARCATDGVG